MFRSISTKLLLAVLAATALPIGGFAFLIEYRVADSLMLEMVQRTLQGLALDLASQLDSELLDRRRSVAGWADSPVADWALKEHASARRERAADPANLASSWGVDQVVAHGRGERVTDELAAAVELRLAQTESFNRYVRREPDLTLCLLIDLDGRLVTCNSIDTEGRPLDEALLLDLYGRDWSRAPWFDVTLVEGEAAVDQHLPAWHTGAIEADSYAIGVSSTVDAFGEPVGVLYAQVQWSAFQEPLQSPVIKEPFQSLVAAGETPSPYAWVWGADHSTILAHDDPSLYGTDVRDLGLDQMVEDVIERDSGLYRAYRFRGERKRAAFHHGLEVDEGGFGWIVGVGIDNSDIRRATSDLRRDLLQLTVLLLLLGGLPVVLISRSTTRPIRELEEHTRKIADGKLDERIEIGSRDEVGRLADAFNTMTTDLLRQRVRLAIAEQESRDQLVKAERDAAWKEMARQIAHDIKNPLTPIQLSLDLLDRSRADRSADRDEILERTTQMMRRQVESLRRIANDFYEFTGGRKASPEAVRMDAALEEVFELHRAWAQEQGVALEREVREAERTAVWVDPDKLRRVMTNLVTNALQAMSDGGRLAATLAPSGEGVELTLRDTGPGLDDDARAHLFEPYFTTKSEGTGLGLAISKRVVEDAHGRITIEPAPDDGEGGALARMWLPGPAARGGDEV